LACSAPFAAWDSYFSVWGGALIGAAVGAFFGAAFGGVLARALADFFVGKDTEEQAAK